MFFLSTCMQDDDYINSYRIYLQSSGEVTSHLHNMDVQTHFDSTFSYNDTCLEDINTIISRDEELWIWSREELVTTNRSIFADGDPYIVNVNPISLPSCLSPENQVSPVTPVTVQMISSIDTDDYPNLMPVINDDERKLKRREQNRKAAKTCREKKKKLADQSIHEYQQASCENTRLQYLLTQAKKERDSLKQEVLNIRNTCPRLTIMGQLSNPINGFQ